MALVRYDLSPVRDRFTGEINTALVGQQVRVVIRDTNTPATIYEDAAGTVPITSSRVTVLSTFAVPTIYHDPANGLLDWLDETSGARGPITSEQGYVEYAMAAAEAAGEAAEDAETAGAAAKDAAEAAAQRGMPAGGVPGQVPVKTGPNDHEVGWGDFVRLVGDQPLRLWGVASSLPPAGSGQQPGDVIFLIGGGA